jgi:hypothetical protein
VNSAKLDFRFTEFSEVRTMYRLHSDSIFPSMRQIPMLLFLCVVVLLAISLMVGCTDGGSQAEQEGQAFHKKRDNVALALRPEHDSGVSGTAFFEDISEGVLVKLQLRGLPKPNEFYLTSTLVPVPKKRKKGMPTGNTAKSISMARTPRKKGEARGTRVTSTAKGSSTPSRK